MITTIIAAHMGSKRLPGKTLMKIRGRTCLEHVVNSADKLNPVVATYKDDINRPIWELCEQKNIRCHVYRGRGEDVLGRFHEVIEKVHPTKKFILRITPDCPMLKHDMVMRFFFRCDFRTDTIYTNRPMDNDGFDMEIFPVEALRQAHKHAGGNGDREHVTSWLYRHLRVDRYSILNNKVGHPEPEQKLSVDTEEEYQLVRTIMEKSHVL